MSRPDLRKLLSTPKGRLVAACGALVLVWLVILVNFSSSFFDSLPSADRLRDAGRELKKVQNELAKALEKEKEFDALNKAYDRMIEHAWIESKHGMAEVALRQKISDAATKLELKPASLGTVRITRINSDFYYAELDIMMNESYDAIIKFIAAVDQIVPHVSWRRINMRPDFRRNNSNNNNQNKGTLSAMRAAAATADPAAVQINFNAAIRVIGFDGKIPVKAGGVKK